MPTPTTIGFRSFEAFALIPDSFSTKVGTWRNTEGEGTTSTNRENPGTSDLVLNGPDADSVFSSTDRLFGDASLHWRPASIDAYGEIADDTSISLSGVGNFSIALWIHPDSAGEGSVGTIWHDQGQLRIRTTAAGALELAVDFGAGFVTYTTPVFLNYGAPEWWFIAFTYSNPTLKFYRGRVTDATTTIVTDSVTFAGTVAASTSTIIVGDAAAAGGSMFDGKLAEVQFIANKTLSDAAINAAFNLPWFYFTQRPQAPWGDGLRDSVLRSRTADNDFVTVQISMSLPELLRRWEGINDVDRSGFYSYFRNVLHDGRDLAFLEDSVDFDGLTERLVRLTDNPFAGFAARRLNRSPLELRMIELATSM